MKWEKGREVCMSFLLCAVFRYFSDVQAFSSAPETLNKYKIERINSNQKKLINYYYQLKSNVKIKLKQLIKKIIKQKKNTVCKCNCVIRYHYVLMLCDF